MRQKMKNFAHRALAFWPFSLAGRALQFMALALVLLFGGIVYIIDLC